MLLHDIPIEKPKIITCGQMTYPRGYVAENSIPLYVWAINDALCSNCGRVIPWGDDHHNCVARMLRISIDLVVFCEHPCIQRYSDGAVDEWYHYFEAETEDGEIINFECDDCSRGECPTVPT